MQQTCDPRKTQTPVGEAASFPGPSPLASPIKILIAWAALILSASAQNTSPTATPTPAPEILTPPAAHTPQIHGPKIFGVRPGSPFLYTIPATGDRPVTFSADHLPQGLQLDGVTGQITGSILQPGDYAVTFHAGNTLGTAVRPFHIVVGDRIGLTPAMGWNSWYSMGGWVNQAKVLKTAQAMVDSGLTQHGWTYVNIDDTWQGHRGGEFNAIQPDPHRFPDIKALMVSIHKLGLKGGIYSTPWVTSYAGKNGGSAENPEGTWQWTAAHGPYRKKILPWAIGQYSFATNDSRQWAAWGVDYLKYDWGPVELPESKEMADALRASKRDILFSLSNNTSGNIFDEIADLSKIANSWRTTTDITDKWASICANGFTSDKWAPFAGPGHFNDPDMLMVGDLPHATHLTPDEQYSQISLWCLISAPLLLSCDLEKLDPFTLGLLTNDEVLDINQDSLGKQATQIAKDGQVQIYAKPLDDGSWAIGFFNRGTVETKATLDFSALSLSGPQSARDLWRQKDLGAFTNQISATVPPHGVILLCLTSIKPQ